MIIYHRKRSIPQIAFCNNLKRKIRNLSEEKIRTIKNQIIYFISRIPSIDSNLLSIGNEVIKVIYEKEQDKYNKRSAAIGATILGNSIP